MSSGGRGGGSKEEGGMSGIGSRHDIREAYGGAGRGSVSEGTLNVSGLDSANKKCGLQPKKMREGVKVRGY